MKMSKVGTFEAKCFKYGYEIIAAAPDGTNGRPFLQIGDFIKDGKIVKHVPEWYPKVWRPVGKVQVSFMKSQEDGAGRYYSIEIRQDLTQRLLINHYLCSDITLTCHHGTNNENNDKNNVVNKNITTTTVMWNAPHNADIFGCDDNYDTTVCLKFLDEAQADDFKLMFTNLQQKQKK